mmetsp:Transcript_106271/g.194764  ORF Transcript_106271/g.194764 Transcript_106271/m.194764 type:complete len:256 (+) Transcript_106271:437-1204(+)
MRIRRQVVLSVPSVPRSGRQPLIAEVPVFAVPHLGLPEDLTPMRHQLGAVLAVVRAQVQCGSRTEHAVAHKTPKFFLQVLQLSLPACTLIRGRVHEARGSVRALARALNPILCCPHLFSVLLLLLLRLAEVSLQGDGQSLQLFHFLAASLALRGQMLHLRLKLRQTDGCGGHRKDWKGNVCNHRQCPHLPKLSAVCCLDDCLHGSNVFGRQSLCVYRCQLRVEESITHGLTDLFPSGSRRYTKRNAAHLEEIVHR